MVLLKGRKKHGGKITVFTGRRSRVFYDGFKRTDSPSHLGASNQEIKNVTDTECEASGSSTDNSYKQRKFKRHQEWTEIFYHLISVAMMWNVPESEFCVQCHQPISHIYRCKDCEPGQYFCSTCLNERHQFPHLHFFEEFKNGTFITLSRDTPIWKRIDTHSCTTTYLKDIVIVDVQGRQHIRRMQFCGCELPALTMLRMKLWPSSPKNPSICFHVGLLEWMTALLTECHVSIKGFCDALHIRFSKHDAQLTNLQIKNLYKVLMNDTMVWYRQFQYKMRYPTFTIDSLDDGTNCPACYEIFKRDIEILGLRKPQ